MDVRCDKCGTEYEFDEARVGDNGVTVKCTACQHVFRVRRPAAATPSAVPGQREWLVKKPDGQMIAFRELTTLQKWIVEGRIGRDDEISRNGETWKRLGNIAELEPFFSVFERARALNDLMATGAIGDRPLIVNGSEVLATMSPLSSIVAASSPLPDRGDGPAARRTSEAPARRSASVVTRSVPARARGPSLITRRPEVAGFDEVSPMPEPAVAPPPPAPNGSYAVVNESSTERSMPSMSRNAAIPTEPVPRVALARGTSGAPVPLTQAARPSREPTMGLEAPPRAPQPTSETAPIAMPSSRAQTETGLLGPGALSDVRELAPTGRRGNSTEEADAIVAGFARKRRRRTATLVLASFMALGLGGGAALATLGPEQNPVRRFAQRMGLLPPPPPAAPDRGSELLEAARRAHERDRLADFAEADKLYGEALAANGDSPTLRADQALVLSTWADALRNSAARDDAAAAQVPPPPDAPERSARAEASRGQASALMKRAFELLRVAYEKEPTGLAPTRALADYYRVQRDESGRFQQLLGAARASAQAAGTTDAATSYVEAAKLAVDAERAAPADLDRAVKLLEDALTVRPALIRARVLLAKIALARGQAPTAEAELGRVLTDAPGHEEATALLARARAGAAPSDAPTPAASPAAPGAPATPAASPAPASPAATASPAAVASAAPSPAATAAPTAAPSASPSPSSPAPSPAASVAARPSPSAAAPAGEGKGADGFIKAGDRLRERGEAWEALLSYEKATVLRPYSGRAYAGMGWCYMDLSKPEAALHQFRKAIAVEPGYPEGHLGHAESYRALGNADKALSSYKRFLDLKPQGPGADSARRAVAALEGKAGGGGGGEETP